MESAIFRSDCADVQDDLELHCPHMAYYNVACGGRMNQWWKPANDFVDFVEAPNP